MTATISSIFEKLDFITESAQHMSTALDVMNAQFDAAERKKDLQRVAGGICSPEALGGARR